jgi:hypothetical protein
MATVCQWFGLKTTRTFFSGLASKPVVTVFGGLASKPTVTVSGGLTSKPAVAVSGGLGLKTSGCGLVIYASKSPRQFPGLGLKTKQATVCRLRHKTDGRASVQDTHQDLGACFTWKQVRLGFPSLASRLVKARRRVVHVAPSQMLRQRQVEDGHVDAMGCIRPCYPYFADFIPLGHSGVVVI